MDSCKDPITRTKHGSGLLCRKQRYETSLESQDLSNEASQSLLRSGELFSLPRVYSAREGALLFAAGAAVGAPRGLRLWHVLWPVPTQKTRYWGRHSALVPRVVYSSGVLQTT